MNLKNLIPESATADLVEIENGQPVTSSLKIAEIFGKQHKHVLRDIQEKVLPNVSEDFGQSNFGPSYYVNEQNKRQPMYYLTRDGFTLVVMGYTGVKAMQFKEAYINEFNKMDALLRKSRPNNDDLIDLAATKITQKLFPQFVKTVSATLSKDIVERVRSLPQGEQLLQPVKAVEPAPKEKPKREYITLYVIFTWDLDGNVTVYKAKDYRDYMYTLKRITAEHKPYRVEKIRTATYK